MKEKLKDFGHGLVRVLMATILFLALVVASVIVTAVYIVASVLLLIGRGLVWCWYRIRKRPVVVAADE